MTSQKGELISGHEDRLTSFKEYIDSKISTFRLDTQKAFIEAVYYPNATHTEKTVKIDGTNDEDKEPN